jgi:hypothetical protein
MRALPRIFPPPLIYKDDWEIDPRLIPFSVTRQELIAIARIVAGARADTVENDPLSAEGQFAYIFGTRATRALWRKVKWLLHRSENIESVRHPTLDWSVTYQNVDLAASLFHDPLAISGKGVGSERFIDASQGDLFERDPVAPSVFKPENSGAWFYCVSVNGEDVRAELSRPIEIGSKNFKGFRERIFIIRDGEWPKLSKMPVPESGRPIEFEPVVTRK